MEMAFILIRQILQMFLLAGVGFLLFKTGKISQEGSKALGNILIYVALPAVIVNSFLVERTPEHLAGILYSGIGAAVLILMSITVSRLVFRNDAIAAFAGAFSNPGFFGVPLIIASVGQGAVFYVACFIAFLNIGQWTYGVTLLNGQPILQGLQPKKLIKAPFILAILVGLLLFFTQLPLPDVVRGFISSAAGLNTPLAMFTVGIYLAQTDLGRMVKRKSLYLVSFVRLLLVPFIGILILALVPASLGDMKSALLLALACPVGSNVAVYAQLHGKDYPYAVETVIVSTVLAIVTMPVIMYLASLIWGV